MQHVTFGHPCYTLQEFDAFVSYAHADFKWVCDELVPRLENRERPFRLCVHERDFLGGADVVENIIASIETSRRTLVVLSNAYIQSEWCRFEFKQAHFKVPVVWFDWNKWESLLEIVTTTHTCVHACNIMQTKDRYTCKRCA